VASDVVGGDSHLSEEARALLVELYSSSSSSSSLLEGDVHD
jgi:hypothetical protein